MYEVFGSITSRGFRVLWALEELGVEYTLTKANPQDEVIRSVYPVGKIPAMRVGDAILTDSMAILTYLSDKHGGLTAPAGGIQRAQQDAISHAILDELDAVLWAGARHSFVLPKEHRFPDVKTSLRWEFNRNVNRLAERIDTPFAAGDAFSVADILLVHCLNWSISAKFDYDCPKMDAYAKTIRARAAFKRVRALG